MGFAAASGVKCDRSGKGWAIALLRLKLKINKTIYIDVAGMREHARRSNQA